MSIGLIGKKIGMSQTYNESGELIPVTVIEAGPCKVAQIKTAGKEGYNAVKLIFGAKKKYIVKAEKGAYDKVGLQVPEVAKEFRIEKTDGYKTGDEIKVDIFKVGDALDITGRSHGKGFQGVVKRLHYKGGQATHGSMFGRVPGSIGSSAFPSRVFKGKGLPGRMGDEQVTTQNLKVVKVINDKNILFVKGAVPGKKGTVLKITYTKKKLSKGEK